MKNSKRLYGLLILLFILQNTVIVSCKKDSTKEEDLTSVTDIEGNKYKVVVIGDQRWMAEDLKTTTLNDGTSINNITNNQQWSSTGTHAYCWYNNDNSNKNNFGALYNFWAVQTGKLCPSGWHVPADSEWMTLENQLGGDISAGGKLKESGTTFWNSPNTGATNASNFNARGGGVRLVNGTYSEMKNYALWWTSSAGGGGAWFKSVNNQSSLLNTQSYNKNNGLSVRCIKD